MTLGKTIEVDLMVDDISVIIRSKNEGDFIGHTIQSVLDHMKNPEIIIVDNQSTDNTLEVARLFQHDTDLEESKNYSRIKIISIDNYTPGKALNLGVRASTRKYVCIISAHCQLQKFDYKLLKNELDIHSCLFGNQIPIYLGKRITKRYLWSHFVNEPIVNMFSKPENRYFMHNALSFFRRDFLLENQFNEMLAGKEDRYWAIKVISEGNSIRYSPEFEAKHFYTSNGNTWKGVG